MKTGTLNHWSWVIDADNILHVTIDRADKSQNSLSSDVLKEFAELITNMERLKPKGVVLRSGKQHSFIVGADVAEFTDFADPVQVSAYIKSVHATLQRLEDLPFPVLAVIDGPCLGGGLELALACRYRLAVDDDRTILGFPEVKLGIHPGFGGTVRSIRQCGSLPALELMLSGRNLTAYQAFKLGLVDAAVPRRVVDNAIASILSAGVKPRKSSWSTRLTDLAALRAPIAALLKSKVKGKADPRHYPAPNALIDLWRQHAGHTDAMYHAEAESIARLICGSVAQNLIRVFFLQTQLKGQKSEGDPIRKIHVIGAGNMGRDIASWCALQGLQVTLQDLDNQVLADAVTSANKLFRTKLKKHHLIQAAHDRLQIDQDGLAVPHADLVIEAIVENRTIKEQVLKNVEARMNPTAILASNTSSIPLEDLAACLENPQRFVGIHFFNPVAKMPLVEIVAAQTSDPAALSRATGFVKQIKHLPLPVKSAPGFLVNRILMPYLMAAVQLVEQGYDRDSIDQAALDFGMPMGPLHLADKVGLDICQSVAETFATYFNHPIPAILTQMIDDGYLGIKSGQGFFNYHNGHRKKSWLKTLRPVKAQPELVDKLLDPLLAEAQACLDEGIVSSADLVDAGMIFGSGFAPFTGGPLHYRNSPANAP